MRGILLLAGLALACAGCAGPYGTGYDGSYGYSSPGYGYGYSAPAYGYGYGPGWGAPAPLFGGVAFGGGGDHHYDHYRHADYGNHVARDFHGARQFAPHAAPHFAAHAAPHITAQPHYRLGAAPGTGINAGRNYGGPG